MAKIRRIKERILARAARAGSGKQGGQVSTGRWSLACRPPGGTTVHPGWLAGSEGLLPAQSHSVRPLYSTFSSRSYPAAGTTYVRFKHSAPQLAWLKAPHGNRQGNHRANRKLISPSRETAAVRRSGACGLYYDHVR